jgi:O-antigen ligase
MELFCKIIGFPYPAVIFNTGKAASTLGYLEQLTGGFYRLTSVAVEPSILSETLLAAIAIYLPYIFGKDRLFGRILDKFLLMLMSSILLLTTSSTGYLGVVIIALNVIGFLVAKRMLRFRYLLIPTFGLLVFIGLYFSIPIVQQILDAALFSKATDYSALERMTTILNAYDMFIQYPILGIGWATVTSHDLIFKILANAGIIALVLFILAMACILYNLQRSINMRSKSLRLAGLMQRDFGIYLALSTILVTSVISGFLNTFSFFWFIIGMAIAEDTRDSNDKLSNKSLTLQGQEPIH